MKHGKRITKVCAVTWLIVLSSYASVLIGSLAHELLHKENAIDTKAIEINYDGSGVHKGYTLEHDHKLVYFKDGIVTTFMITISALSLLVLVMA